MASMYWDVNTQGPTYANTHAQRLPAQSLEEAIAAQQQFVQQQLQTGTLVGLGYANHSAEDVAKHNFEPFIAMNFLDPKYLAHLLGDWVPWPWELWDSFKS